MRVMQAASESYDATLAPVHTYFVRTAVKASLYLLPDRATFLRSIGETGAACPLALLKHSHHCIPPDSSMPSGRNADAELQPRVLPLFSRNEAFHCVRTCTVRFSHRLLLHLMQPRVAWGK